MALYRTYRPLTFADVVGQDHVVTTLEQAVSQDKISHAYLFAGARGTGKTSIARILAKSIMTRGIGDEKLKQQITRGIEEGSIVDLLEIDAASNRRIDDARELIEKIQFSPVVASAKVYIIDEAHMLTKEAFNALLKTLEEPPEYAHFILATTEIHKIPATIQSRCQCFPFRSIREEDIVRRLQYIADQERITVDREALRLIARHVEGGLRDAISLLDQMRSLPKITVKEVEQRLGSTGQEHIEIISQAIEAQDAPALLKTVERLEEEGIPLDLFLRQLLTMVRDQLHASIEKKEDIRKYSHILDVLLQAIRDVRVAPVPGLVVEAALLSLCKEGIEEPKTSSFSRNEEKAKAKKKLAKEEAAPEETKEEKPMKESPMATAEIKVPEATIENIRASWDSILQDTSPPAVRMSLKNGVLQSIQDSKVVVSFSSASHRDRVAAPDASRAIEQVMQRIFKRALRLECVLEKEEKEPGDSGKESMVNLAEAAAEIF